MKTALRMLLYPRNTSNQEKTFILVKTDDFFVTKFDCLLTLRIRIKSNWFFLLSIFAYSSDCFSFLFTSRLHARVRKLFIVHKWGPSVDVVERTLRFRIASGRIPGWRKSADVFVPRSLRRLSPRERKNVCYLPRRSVILHQCPV